MSIENLQQQVLENPSMQVTISGSDLLGMISEVRNSLVAELRSAIKDAVLQARGDMLSGVRALYQEKVMTVKEVASLLGVDLSTLYRWDKQGVLKRQRIGGKVVYRASDVEQIVKSRKS